MKKKILSLITALMISIGSMFNLSFNHVYAATSDSLSISQNGINFICELEGFHSKCYKDNTQSSIGYGTKCTGSSEQPHAAGLHSITKEEALAEMKSQLDATYTKKVRSQTSGITMSQNQFDALVSLCYNTGGGTTRISNSPLVKYLKGNLTEAEARSQYSSYFIKSGGVVLNGLINRRNREADLFFSNSITSPDAPILTINRGTSLTTDTITISWPPANGAESYWLHIYKDGEDYVNQSINQDLSYSAKYPAGNYAAYVVSCNNGLEALSLVEFTVYDATPLNLGNSFNAYIVNNAPWKMLTVEDNNNVGLYTENRKAEQMWQFTRRADGSYEILNSKTGLALDSGDANNTNLFTFADCDNEWQSWYIYGSPDNYFFKSKYSGKVIDVAGGATDDGTNVQMYEFNDTAAQKFSIYYFDHGSNLGVIQNLGDKFTARIVNNLSQKPIQPKEDTSVVLQSEANNIGQLWEFTRNSDGSYKIMNCKSGLVLDSGGENNTVYMHNDYGNIYQNWYIFGTNGNYCFKSQATNYVIEAWGGATDDGTIIQLYDSNGTETQKFHMDIFDINKEVGNLNLDDSFNIADVILFKEYLTSVKQISEIQYLVADVNQDGKINVFDIMIIKRQLLAIN